MNRNKENNEVCPTEYTMDLISGKWKGMILFYLCDCTIRYSQLKSLLKGVSPRMLTKQLRELESTGIVYRKVYPEIPPKSRVLPNEYRS